MGYKLSEQCPWLKLNKLLHFSLLLISRFGPCAQFVTIVQPAFMDVQSVSLFQKLILGVKSIASSVAQISELIEGEQRSDWKRAQLCPGRLCGPFTPLAGGGAAGKCPSKCLLDVFRAS